MEEELAHLDIAGKSRERRKKQGDPVRLSEENLPHQCSLKLQSQSPTPRIVLCTTRDVVERLPMPMWHGYVRADACAPGSFRAGSARGSAPRVRASTNGSPRAALPIQYM